MSPGRFDARDWLQRWTGSGNVAFATTEPEETVTFHFDGDNVAPLMEELRAADGERRVFAALCTLGKVLDAREATHG